MKILSENLSMQTEHIFSQSSFETFRSFTSYLAPTQQTSMKKDAFHIENSHSFTRVQTINSIIQRLIEMLQERVTQQETKKESQPKLQTHAFFHHRYKEFESFEFSTKGSIQTATQNIDLNINFSMSRSFMIDNAIDIYSSFDPLIINLDGLMPELSEDTFSFDLDNDGEKEQISKLKKGSGFLALDKNGDGEINQGSELFGTLTGNGFSELAEYDEDKNRWIDESDAIFKKLRIWLRDDASDTKELVGLGEVGIGAIFLDAQKAEFEYKTTKNHTLGELKASSFLLNEDGSVGNISQIDLTTKKEEPLATLLKHGNKKRAF